MQINGAEQIANVGGYKLTWDRKIVHSPLSSAYGRAFTWNYAAPSAAFIPKILGYRVA